MPSGGIAGCVYCIGLGAADADGCGCIFFIQSGNTSGCTRLAAEILSCGACCDAACFSCNHAGRDCSSINELADMPLVGINPPSVFGAGIEAGRCTGCAPEGGLSSSSACSGRIQLGNIPSSTRSLVEKLGAPGVDAVGRSLVRNVSNHAGSSG